MPGWGAALRGSALAHWESRPWWRRRRRTDLTRVAPTRPKCSYACLAVRLETGHCSGVQRCGHAACPGPSSGR
eukprot:13495659-Alexandrium_andersonii.AAC.1